MQGGGTGLQAKVQYLSQNGYFISSFRYFFVFFMSLQANPESRPGVILELQGTPGGTSGTAAHLALGT